MFIQDVDQLFFKTIYIFIKITFSTEGVKMIIIYIKFFPFFFGSPKKFIILK